MAKYRRALPQLGDQFFLTDGGIETVLVFQEQIELPHFAAFNLLRDEAGAATLRRYFAPFARLARDHGLGFVLESATWRASPDWGRRLGYSPDALAVVQRRAIALLEDVRAEFETSQSPMVISGCVGPRGDGYRPDARMSATKAQAYHSGQVRTFAGTAADMVTAVTMNYVEEAIGVARAAAAANIPVAVSFTVETDGRLPTGQSLADAIVEVDDAVDPAPVYYMLNCAHPTHFERELDGDAAWTRRLRGVRANASRQSHAELDNATELDDGNPHELAMDYHRLLERLPHLRVFGGCCGTDIRHVEQICVSCMAAGRVPNAAAA